MRVPDSVTSIGEMAFSDCRRGLRIYFMGYRTGFESKTPSYASLWVPRSCAGTFLKDSGISRFGGYVESASLATVEVLSSRIRESDPTVMDVVYKVTSGKPTVKVRVLAFEDGERSFAKVVRPETFVKDVDGNETAQNVGDSIEANALHKLSWKVSSDWATRLAKMKFEVLVLDGDLLPLTLRTISPSDQYGKMKVSWNAITEALVFDALLWLYADKDAGLTLSGGTLKNGSTLLASGADLAGSNSYYDENGRNVGLHLVPNANAARYVFGKMGYSLLEGTPLNYANSETRLGLKPYGARQYAYKVVEE